MYILVVMEFHINVTNINCKIVYYMFPKEKIHDNYCIKVIKYCKLWTHYNK